MSRMNEREITPDAMTPAMFHNYLLNKRRGQPVVITLMTGERVEGRVTGFDNFIVWIDRNGTDVLIYKHALAKIEWPSGNGGKP